MTQSDSELDAHVNENWGNAERLLEYLGDRRLLTEDHAREDPAFCVESAIAIRSTMGVLMGASTVGPLKTALRDIQRFCREFVSAAGPHGAHFQQDSISFATNLVALRIGVARQVYEVITLFKIHPNREISLLLQLIDSDRRSP
ncbi:hypothetical protein GH740_03775 [Microbacterium sp. SYP-A9085]|uniref:hypothetical protein n=1 Tax=Microbacterium sp. SYP-A9085 TaxID=2664454 RepID=UPI00129B2CB6|nr:hypothetical protein [Microbacterium sp. SYP-A9085]MRH28431.1 hypothetical protein [Microbacterium sp. SYP-A9085]